MRNSEIYKRLYNDYSKKFLNKIILSLFFSILANVDSNQRGCYAEYLFSIECLKRNIVVSFPVLSEAKVARNQKSWS